MKSISLFLLLIMNSALYAQSGSDLYGTYVGEKSTTFGKNAKCSVSIDNHDSTSIHFEFKLESGLFKKTTQRLMSIKGSKEHFLNEAATGMITVKRINELDKLAYNYGYVLPHHFEMDLGTSTIILDGQNTPIEFIHERRGFDETHCTNLIKVK